MSLRGFRDLTRQPSPWSRAPRRCRPALIPPGVRSAQGQSWFRSWASGSEPGPDGPGTRPWPFQLRKPCATGNARGKARKAMTRAVAVKDVYSSVARFDQGLNVLRLPRRDAWPQLNRLGIATGLHTCPPGRFAHGNGAARCQNCAEPHSTEKRSRRFTCHDWLSSRIGRQTLAPTECSVSEFR